MSEAPDPRLLEALLDSWDRNNTILRNLLRALPRVAWRSDDGGQPLDRGAVHAHHYVSTYFVSEDAPEFARDLPEQNGGASGTDRLAQRLDESAQAVRTRSRAGWKPAGPWTCTTTTRSSSSSTWSGTRATITARSSWPQAGGPTPWPMRRSGRAMGRVDAEDVSGA